MTHPLLDPATRQAIEEAMTRDLGRAWTATGFTNLDDRASHPCGVLHGVPPIFAKLDTAVDGAARHAAERRGLLLVHERAGVLTPAPIGIVATPAGSVLLLHALAEVPKEERTPQQWAAIGHALALVHAVTGSPYGLDFNGYFGPLPQDNRPLPTWAEFFAQRRLLPLRDAALASRNLPTELAHGVDRLVDRLPLIGGPEPRPSLLHGDAQQHNLLTTVDGAVLIDVSPYFGHPEFDLALIDYFAPVPAEVFAGYREVRPIDDEFPQRRELWRVPAYLAVLAVEGLTPFGRPFLDRLDLAIKKYL